MDDGKLRVWFVVYEVTWLLTFTLSGLIIFYQGYAHPLRSIDFIKSHDLLSALTSIWLSNVSSFLIAAILIVIHPLLGPYKLCRHPFYFFVMVAQISLPTALLSLWGFVVALTFIPLWLYLVKLKERELITYWGERCLMHMRETPTLIPNLRRLRRLFK